MKHLILPLIIVGLFIYGVKVETDIRETRAKPSSRVMESVDVVIEPDKSEDSSPTVKEVWDDLITTMKDLLMEDLGLKKNTSE